MLMLKAAFGGFDWLLVDPLDCSSLLGYSLVPDTRHQTGAAPGKEGPESWGWNSIGSREMTSLRNACGLENDIETLA